MSHPTQLRVVYDADCALCRNARTWVERRDDERRILFEPADPDIPVEARVLTVQDATGDEFGFYGWVTILEHLPLWRRLAGVLRRRPMCLVGIGIYRIVAAHRGRMKRPR